MERFNSPPRQVFDKVPLGIEGAYLHMHESDSQDNDTVIGIPGGSGIELSAGPAIKIQRFLGANGATPFIKESGICGKAAKMGHSAGAIDALDIIFKRNFHLEDYTRAVDDALTKVFDRKNQSPVIAISESIGGLALMDAIVKRIESNEPIPKIVFLINFPVGGLNPLAIDYLRWTGQMGKNSIPAIHQLKRDSEYLTRLRESISKYKGQLPRIVSFAGDAGMDALASPWGISLDPKHLKIAEKYGSSSGGDGIFELDGMHLMEGGIRLTDPARTNISILYRSIHAMGTRDSASSFINYLLTGMLPGSFIDCSDFLESKTNKAANIGMKVLAWTKYRQ